MAETLHDFRGKHTSTIKVALEAEVRSSGQSAQVIEREIMEAWAAKKLHGARLLVALAAAEGIAREDEGTAGQRPATKHPRR